MWKIQLKQDVNIVLKILTVTVEVKIRHEKLKYDIISEAAKISALIKGKTDKYEHIHWWRNIAF